MRMSVVVLCSSMLACTASNRAPRDAGGESDAAPGRDAGTTSDAGFDSGANPVSSLDDERRCMEVQTRIYDIVRSRQACTTEEDCIVGQLDIPCFERFACPQAWSKSTNLDELKQTVLSLRSKYEQSCHRCEARECALSAAHARAFCDPVTKLCTSYSSQLRDADAGARTADAGPTTAVASSPYACQGSDDCVIQYGGACCSYPRCANADVTFGQPWCPATVACVDGYPSYDHCECRDNVCRTMLGDASVY